MDLLKGRTKLLKKSKKGTKVVVVDPESPPASPPSVAPLPSHSFTPTDETPDGTGEFEESTSSQRVISPGSHSSTQTPQSPVRLFQLTDIPNPPPPIPLPSSSATVRQSTAALLAENSILVETVRRLQAIEAESQKNAALLQSRTQQVQELEHELRALHGHSSAPQRQSVLRTSSSASNTSPERELEITTQTANALRIQLDHAELRIKELEDYIRSDDMLDLLESTLRTIQERADSRDNQFANTIQSIGKGKRKRMLFEERSRLSAAITEQWKRDQVVSGSDGHSPIHGLPLESLPEVGELPPLTNAFADMATQLYNFMAQQRMSSDVQWRDLYEGPPNAHYWVSTISLKGKPIARAHARVREEARDKAAYSALMALHIPLLYPDNSYPFTNRTARLNDHLTRSGKTGTLTWETERMDHGKSWESVALIDGEPYGTGIGPSLICSRDMAAHQAAQKLGAH